MPEKSATAVQTAPSRPPVKAGSTESLMQRIQRLNDAISRRAFELFEQNGRIDGQDQRHWLEAERELVHPMHVRLDDSDEEIVLHAEVPGFTADDLEVNVEPRRITIAGKRASFTKKEHDNGIYTRECSDEIFQSVDLPCEVNAAKVSAMLKDGVLDIQLPKMPATQPAPTESQLP
jgi:HSP20 family protein